MYGWKTDKDKIEIQLLFIILKVNAVLVLWSIKQELLYVKWNLNEQEVNYYYMNINSKRLF